LRRIKRCGATLAGPGAIGYACGMNRLAMNRQMTVRLAALCGLVLLAASLGGCTKCGWLWNDQGPGTCHSGTPR